MDRRVPRKTENKEHRREFISSTSFGSVFSVIFYESFKAIIGFITLWFFKPVWYKIVEKWNSRKNKDTEESPKTPE